MEELLFKSEKRVRVGTRKEVAAKIAQNLQLYDIGCLPFVRTGIETLEFDYAESIRARPRQVALFKFWDRHAPVGIKFVVRSSLACSVHVFIIEKEDISGYVSGQNNSVDVVYEVVM